MKRSWLLVSALVTVLMVLSLFTACGGTPAPKGKTGGTLKLASNADRFFLDPSTTTQNWDIMYHLAIYEVLYRVNKTGTELIPSAATGYKVSADGKSWTFTLKKGMKFSDGSAMTSKDWKFSVERGMKPEAFDAWAWEATGLKTMDTPDDNTIVFNLDKPFVPFLSYLAGFWAEVFSEKAITAQGDKFWDKPVCSGPFMVKEHVQSDHLTLVPNPYALVKPLLSEIILTNVPDTNTRVLQLQSGAVDVAIEYPFNQIDATNALPGLVVGSYPFAYNATMYLNHKKAPFDDLNFRMALNYATDRQALIKAVTFGKTTEWTNVAPKGIMYRNDAQKGYTYDLAKAKEYMAKSKYASGTTVDIEVAPTSSVAVQTVTALQAMWQQLPNVKVNIAQYESAVLRQRRTDGLNPATFGGFSSDVIDPDEILSWFLVGYVNDVITHADVSTLLPIVEQARVEGDAAKRKDLYYKVQQWATDNAYAVGLWYQNNDWGMKKTVKDFWVDPVVGCWLWETYIE